MSPVPAQGVKCLTGRSFRELHYLFTGMLVPSQIPLTRRWIIRARLWRLILLQTPEGYFDISDGLAFALNAHVEDDDDANDCPLTCQPEAIWETVPELEFTVGADGLTEEQLEQLRARIWVRCSQRLALTRAITCVRCSCAG